MKKSLLILSLGLAASLQAQEAPAAEAAPVAEASQPAVEAEQAQAPTAQTPAEEAAPVAATPAEENTPVANTAQPAEAAPAVEQPAEAPMAETPAEAAPVAEQPVENASAEQPVEAAPAEENVQAAEAPAAEQPAESAPVAQNAEQAPAANDVAAAQPAAPKTAGPLDVLHGSAYNTVGNEAAGSTIAGNMATPRKMFGTKAVYFEPISERAIVSFGDARTYFIGFDNSKDLGILTAGMSFGKFGFSVDGSLGKQWLDVEAADGTEHNAISTVNGTMVGARASLLVGPMDIVLSGHFAKPNAETYLKTPNSELDPKAWEATGKAAVSYSGKSIFWTAGIDVLRHDFKVKTMNSNYQVIDGENKLVVVKTSVSDTSSRLEVTPSFNIGGAVLEAEDAKVYIGVNTTFPIACYDEIENITDEHTKFSAYLSPNIFGEVALSQYFMAFGGASFDWNAFSLEKKELNGNKETSRETVSSKTNVNLGARFQYNRIALEAAFTKQFLQNPFSGFAKADGIAWDIGAFINF